MVDKASPFDAIFNETGPDPMETAQRGARPDLPKRFWDTVTLDARSDGFHLLLDGRQARTPGRLPLMSAHAPVAERMREEWAALDKVVDPTKLPVTRLINVARDADDAQRDALLDDVRRYAETDLLCYRADRPQGLVDRQDTVWSPYLDRLKTHHGIRLRLASGIMHVAQDAAELDAIRDLADDRARDSEALCALHLATSLSGSAVLALALTEPGEDEGRAGIVWQAAHVDEDWNRAQWGEDAEARAQRALRWRDFEAAAFVLSVTRR